MATEPTFLSWGSTPHPTDTVNTLLKRIAGGIANGGGGGGGGGSGLAGTVNPEGSVSAAVGTTYVNTSNQTFWVKSSGGSGNTGWVQYV